MERRVRTIPEEMQFEILLRMPLKSLLKCMCVSKKWEAIIRGQQFKELYFLRSITRPRLMIVVFPMVFNSHHVLFNSVYQEEKPLLSSGWQQHALFPIESNYEISQSIRGLVCLHGDTEAVICNPGTKRFVSLPEIQATQGASITAYFGYDEATDVYKVLCMAEAEVDEEDEEDEDDEDNEPSEGAKEYQVLTVREGEAYWRPITCDYPHFPVTKGLCKDGVLYYGALRGGKHVIIRFNVRTEEFSCVPLPEVVKINVRWKLVDYKGRVGVANDPMKDMRDSGVFLIWVMDETAKVWIRIRFVIPGWRETVGDTIVSFKGTIGTGELVFAPNILVEKPLVVLYYNTTTKKLRSFTVEGVSGCPYGYVQTDLDHVDSLMFM